jgi:hypothetical protein
MGTLNERLQFQLKDNWKKILKTKIYFLFKNINNNKQINTK